MGIAASGPKDNASKDDGLGDAISAALDHHDTENLSDLLKDEKGEKDEPEDNSGSSEESAGDETVSEDAEAGQKPDEESGEFEALSAPKHWPEADKKAFAKLPRDAQEIVLRRSKDLEGGFTRKSQELSDKARFADDIRGLLDDATRAQLRAVGTDEAGYFRYLHSLQQHASADPVGYVKMAMQYLGVTPDKLGLPQSQPTAPQNVDEEINKLLVDPKVAELEARVQKLQSIIDQEQSQRQQAAYAQHVNVVNSLASTIKAFRESLDEHGQLKYPHFDSVRSHMAALLESDPDLKAMPESPEKLQRAYDMAVWARPDLRQSLVEAEAQRKIQEAQKKREAERAKKAAGIKPAAGIVSTKPKARTLDDAISEAMSKAGL